MNTFRTDSEPRSVAKDLALTLYRTVRSTFFIGMIVVGFLAIRGHRIDGQMLREAWAAHGTVIVIVFLGIGIWDYTFFRAKRRTKVTDESAD